MKVRRVLFLFFALAAWSVAGGCSASGARSALAEERGLTKEETIQGISYLVSPDWKTVTDENVAIYGFTLSDTDSVSITVAAFPQDSADRPAEEEGAALLEAHDLAGLDVQAMNIGGVPGYTFSGSVTPVFDVTGYIAPDGEYNYLLMLTANDIEHETAVGYWEAFLDSVELAETGQIFVTAAEEIR